MAFGDVEDTVVTESVSAAAAERAFRHRIEVIVPRAEIASLTEPSLRDSVRMLAVLWLELVALLAAANVVADLGMPWSVVVSFVIVVGVATRINAFNVVMHEGSHGFLAARRAVNDALCDAAASWWMLHCLADYGPAHRMHHRFLHEAADPDLDQYALPEGAGALRRLVLEDLVGLTALRRGRMLMSTSADVASGRSQRRRSVDLIGRLAAQLAVLGQFVLFQGLATGVAYYAVFWLVPVLCVFPVIKRLKAITEHHDARLLTATGSAPWVARASAVGLVQDHLIGARMEYHFEHHVYPGIPFRGLRALHARLVERGFFADLDSSTRSDLLSGGYVGYVARLPTSARPLVSPR